MHPRLDGKLALLYTLLILQVLIVMIYVASISHISNLNGGSIQDSVSFINAEPAQNTVNNTTYLQIIQGETTLQDTRTSRLFQFSNETGCYNGGINNDRSIITNEVEPDRCTCQSGWHGSDCGQPEVVWRAIMASKQKIKLKRRRLARRLIHAIYVHDYDVTTAEVIVEELYEVVDLFVICDLSQSETNFRHKLAKGLLRGEQNKIMYLNVASKARKPQRVLSKYVWDKVRGLVKNIRDDDLYVISDSEHILNSRALMFLKIYDGWPQPIGFRLRWTVFGFFWQHPTKTTITIGACTVGLMSEAHKFNSLVLEKELTSSDVPSNRENLGLVIGDLNHYGGWHCQFCQGPANIILELGEKNRTREMQVDKTFDVAQIEELIGSGTWFDEKTNLLRAHKSKESYFAPETVLNKTWKYNWLVENFYAKMDYY